MLMFKVERDSYSIKVFIQAHETVPWIEYLWCKPGGDLSLIPGTLLNMNGEE